MYKLINKIDQIESSPRFINDTSFIANWRNRVDWQGILKCYSIEDYKILWQINDVYGGVIYKDEIITSNLDIYDKDGVLIYSRDKSERYHVNYHNGEGKLLCFSDEDNQHLFDANTKEFVCKNMKFDGYVMCIKDNYFIIRTPNEKLQIYNFTQSETIWERDFSEIAAYNDPLNDRPMRGEIGEVYIYKKDRLIVCTKYKSTYCFELHIGKLLWECPSYARTIEIVGEISYVCTGGGLYKLNLETGVRSEIYPATEGRMHDIVLDEDIILWPSGHKVVYHEGLLWYSIYSSGYSYLLAINPYDGHYEWVHEVITHEKTDSPVFYKDKMYIWDTGGVLHVYEKIA